MQYNQMLPKFLLTHGAVDVAARRLLDACNRPRQVVVGRRCVFSRLAFCNCVHLRSLFNSECGGGKPGAPVWPPVPLTVQTSVLPSPSRARLHFSANSTESSPLNETHAVSVDSPEMRGSTAKGAQREGGQHVKPRRAQATGCQQPQPASSSACGLSYSKFVRKCSDWLTDRQLERVAVRLKAYKCLKKAPRPHNKLAAVRDIGKIVPKEHRGELMELLAESLDLVDPHHFLRLSKASSDRMATQDEVGDGMPQSIMGDYTVGAELLRSQEHRRTKFSQRTSSSAEAKWENHLHSPDPLADDSQLHQREIAMRPPTPTRLTEKRIGEFVVDWHDHSIPETGSRSKNLVFLSNLPHAPRHILTDVLCRAFSGCGKIKRLEIFDDRLRTLDQTEDNTLQAKGEQAIRDKLERRFSPIFALAEFSSTQEKQNACSTYLRTFGVPCIDRLVYPEDAAVKTTLIATNLPFILTPDEVARILSFALVRDTVAPVEYPGVCRIRMTNPKLFGYEQLFVEARSDAAEPFFLLPLHKKAHNNEAVAHNPCVDYSNFTDNKFSSNGSARTSNVSVWKTNFDCCAIGGFSTSPRSPVMDSCKRVLLYSSPEAHGNQSYCEPCNIVSPRADESIFIPRLRTEEETRDHQNAGRRPGSSGKTFDLGRHIVKKVLTNRLVLNNDGLFVLRFASFEAAEAAVRRCRGAVIYDSKALLLFSPRRCVFHNGQLVDFVIPEGNFAAESKHFVARG